MKEASKTIYPIFIFLTFMNITIVIFSSIFLSNVPKKKDVIRNTSDEIFVNSSIQEKDNATTDKKKLVKAAKVKTKKNKVKDVDSSMTSMYQSLIVGEYEVGNDCIFRFNSNNSFDGYFDAQHVNVTGYQYEVVSTGGNNVLNIYNKGKNAVVSYYVMLNEDADILLYYPDADVKIVLD